MKMQKAFGTAELAAMTEKQQIAYQESLIHYSDMKNMIDTAVEEAVEIAIIDTCIEIAENAIIEGATNEFIAKTTGLTVEEVQNIRLKIN